MQAVGDFSGKLEDDLLFCEQCRLFFRESCPRHGTPHFVRDAPVEGERERGRGRRRERSVGGCRAVLSLPQGLELRERGSAGGTLGVFCAQSVLPQGWIFGPYEGEVLLDRQECTVYSWAIKENGSYFYVDASDESSSNWMRYVACASNEEEHNLTAFQYRGRIYYRTNRPVSAGTELLVWIGEEYAHTLGLRLGEHFKYEFGEKELLMRLFQDLQVPPSSLAARPRPSSSSSSSSSSAGRPGNGDPSAAAAAAGSTRSQAGLESRASGAPCGQPGQCGAPVSSGCPPYPFLEGTQNLVSLGRAQSRYWTFFGFQGDALGRILDKTKIVCKLCAVRLSYSGNTTNLRQHLVYKHRPEYNQLVGAAPPLPPAPPAPSPPAGPGPGPAAALIPRSGRPHDGAAPPAPAARPPPAPAPPAPRAPTHAIADFLVRDLLPPETVEGEGFVQLIAALRPSCAVPSAACLSRTVLREAHRRGRERGAELLRGGPLAGPGPVSAAGSGSDSPLSSSSSSSSLLLGSGVALSADVWRHGAPGPPASYVTLSAHFVDDGFACRHLVLSTRRLGAGPGGGGGGGGDVRAAVRAAAQEWGVEEPSFLVLGAAETGLWDGTGEGEAGEEEEEEEEEAGAKKRGQGTPSEQQQGKQGKREWGSRSEQGDGGEEEEEEEEGGGPRGKRGRGGGEEGASRSEQGDRGGADPELFRAAPEEGALEGGDPEPPAPGGAAWPPIPCAGAALRECVERVLGRPDVSRALRRARALAGRLLAAEPRGRESPPPSPSPSPSSSSSSSSGLDGHPQLKRCLRALAQGGPCWQEAYGLVQALADSRPLMAELLARAEASGRGGERPPSGPEPCPPASPYPQGSDWLLLRELAAVLKPLAVACGTLARERYPGLSLLRPVLAGLVSRHFAPRAADSAFARAAKRALRESLVRAYGQPGLRRALNLACALDPRFRGLDFLEPGERVDTFARLRREVAGLAGEAGWGGEAGRGGPGRGEAGGGRRGLGSAGEGGGQSRDQDSREAGGGAGHGGGEGAPSARKRPRRAGGEEEGEGGAGPAPEYEPVRIGAEAGSGEGAEEEERGPAPGREEEEEGEAGGEGRGPASSSSSTPPGRAAPSGIEFLLGDLCGARARSASQRAEREIAAFRAEDGAPLAADPLLWWRARRAQFPLLARAARRFLAPPATAAPAPWLLTEAGAAVLRRRAALPPESLDQLLFLHGNQLSVETDP